MKKIIFGSVSALLLALSSVPIIGTSVRAQADESFAMEAHSVGMGITPYTLVFLGYQGFFEDEGIPMGSGFVAAYKAEKVDAQSLVQAAINMKRLPPDTINDPGYINSVMRQLELLNTD